MKFMKYLYEDAKTLYEVFRRGARISSKLVDSLVSKRVIDKPDVSLLDNGPCLGWREGPNKPYQWMTYEEALLRAKNLGSGLVSLGLQPGPSTFVGIYCQNCPEWVIAEQAMFCYSMVIVPLYDTLGPEACKYIINQGNLQLILSELISC